MVYHNLIDQHVHTDNSFDGNHNVMFICEKAIENDMRGITFTDHCDIDSNMDLRRITVSSYVETIRARSAFVGRLVVGTGIELGQPIYNIPLSEKIINAFNYDFVLGSIHNLRDKTDFYFLDYSKYTDSEIKALVNEYFETMYELVEWNRFDCLAHLTYPLRYIVGESKRELNIMDFRDIISDILSLLAKNEKALEVNTSGLRQPIGETLPSSYFVKWFKDLGGKYITLGSDAHYATDVGSGFDKGLKMVYDCGFRNIALYEQREPILIPIE